MRYYLVDAFTDRLFSGNPAGVCLADRPLSPELMQRIAGENNLPETAFLEKGPEGWSIRWFTPSFEMDLCGHATLAAGFVLMNLIEPGDEAAFSSCSGPLRVLRREQGYALDFPSRPPREIPIPEGMEACLGERVLGCWQSRDRIVLLENAEDPLECGIDIIARPPGKRPQSVTLLSGGERTMTAVALLFAIFMIKPAPFCMLDELDAALDDANIGRFVDALKEFLDRSQFLIITHNQHTIAGSDLVYGVSQQEKGVSRIISMRLTDIGVKPVPEDTKQKKDQEH